MRDVERRFALPWSIYSRNSMASSRYQISSNQQKRKLPDAVDRNFLLSDVEPHQPRSAAALAFPGIQSFTRA